MGNCLRARLNANSSLNSNPTSTDATKVPSSSIHSLAYLRPKLHGYHDEGIQKTLPTPKFEGDILSSPYLKAFTFNDLKNATRNFHAASLIGEGGFGHVYKGWIDVESLGAARPKSGTIIAVKKLKAEGFQGHKEWLSEVNYLGKLRHPNLVKLFGYCLHGDNRLLVYEYMPKGSLENHLFCRGSQPLPWEKRIKVAIGAAQGLVFLHESEQPVIYRDFKASNILVDLEFNAKLSDFGFAKAGPTGDHTHVSTRVLGTEGYAAPEYIATGHLTARCDVYSFGVVLLELLSGRHAVDKTKPRAEQNLVIWARPYLGDRKKLFRIMDTKLEGQYPRRAAYGAAILALQCIREAKVRPQMSEVLAKLKQLPAMRHPVSTSPRRKSLSSPDAKSSLVHNHHRRHHHHHDSAERKFMSGYFSDIPGRSTMTSPAKSPI